MWKFLKSNTTESTMRVNVTLMGLSSTMISLSLCFNIIYNTLYRLPVLWENQAILLGGITTLMTGVLWQKSMQKKTEMFNQQSDNINQVIGVNNQPIINK